MIHVFDRLGFLWKRSVVPAGQDGSTERAVLRYHQSLAEFVYDAGALEGNPITYSEVEALLDGEDIGNRDIADKQQILNLGQAATRLFDMVRDGAFHLDKPTSDDLHRLVATGEALDPGHFRGEGDPTNNTFWPSVYLGKDERYWPLPTKQGAPDLNRVFMEGVKALEAEIEDPRERGMAYFLFGALQQFYFDGNKRTARFMMNGVLMTHGVDAISVPAVRLQDFNEKMVRFYTGKDGTEMMLFLADCQPKNAPKPETDKSTGFEPSSDSDCSM